VTVEAERKPLVGIALKRFLRQVERPAVELVFLLHDVEDPVNVGSIFRIADACRVREMLLSGVTATPPHRLISKTARHKERRVPWEHVASPHDALTRLRGEGFACFAVELTGDARLYTEVDYPDRVALLVGNEDHGIPKKVLADCDGVIFLPMFGKGASLNVAVSLGIVAYHLLTRKLFS